VADEHSIRPISKKNSAEVNIIATAIEDKRANTKYANTYGIHSIEAKACT